MCLNEQPAGLFRNLRFELLAHDESAVVGPGKGIDAMVAPTDFGGFSKIG